MISQRRVSKRVWAAFMLLALQNKEDDTNYLVRRFYIDGKHVHLIAE